MIQTIEGVTYGDLSGLLKEVGFTEHERSDARSYTYPNSNAYIVYPLIALGQNVYWHHLLAARTTLDGFGILSSSEFDRRLNRPAISPQST